MERIRAGILVVVIGVCVLAATTTAANAAPLAGTVVLPDDPSYADADPGDPGFPPDQ